VFTSADFIEALRKRGRRSLRPDTPNGEFPPGWQAWLDAMTTHLGAVTGAAADGFVALFLEREPALPPPRMAALTHWQAFATLWRQQWQAPAPEERRMRFVAMAITFAIHLVLLVLLIWIAFVRFTGAPPRAAEEVVQVEFIGRGTPEQNGGAPPSPQAQPARPARAAQAARAAHAPARPAATPPAPAQVAAAAPPAEVTAPAAAPPAPSQPLQVSNVPQPTTTFVLPPPTERAAEVQQVQAPTLQVAPREMPMIERAQPIEAARPQLTAPQLRAPALQPDVTPTLPEVQQRTVEVPVAHAPTLQAQTREVPLREPTPPTPAPPAAAATTPAPAASAATTAVPKASAPSPAPAPGVPAATPSTSAATTPAAPSSVAGTRTGTTPGARAPTGTGPGTAKPGAWPSPVPNDEWGNAPRNRPGEVAGTPGTGVPPGTPGAAPPGSVTEQVDLDRAGKWLKRPPVGYTPTRFDKFWTPSETLLEEWVRKNIRSVSIPIPGTSKSVHCVISILQLGGGCGIEDPNMQDQEADSRKPPDVPFKPDLQEDQGALHKPGTP